MNNGKKCERCGIDIPPEFGNPLCLACYRVIEEENAAKRTATLVAQQTTPSTPTFAPDVAAAVPVGTVETTTSTDAATITTIDSPPAPAASPSEFGILDPAYTENPEQEDKDQILANLAQFIYTHRDASHPKGRKHGVLLYYPQRNMYQFIKNYMMRRAVEHPQFPKYIWKPNVVDVGCGSGVGSNILSQEANFVWGIDKNEFSIEFAKEAFTREKNKVYYTPQVSFDIVDIMSDNREFMKFDYVVAIEVIEHIYDTHQFLRQLIGKFTKRDKRGNAHIEPPTEFFISTPNRAHPKIRKDKPENMYHVREWTGVEFDSFMRQYFERVEFLNQKGEPVLATSAVDQVLLVKCWHPKI